MTTSLPHPSHFVKHAAAYFDTLVWPRQPQIDDPGISWLELFIACVSATACRVPNQRGRYSISIFSWIPWGLASWKEASQSSDFYFQKLCEISRPNPSTPDFPY